MKRVHYIDNYLINPQHPVTVNLIGAGGTGSQATLSTSRSTVRHIPILAARWRRAFTRIGT